MFYLQERGWNTSTHLHRERYRKIFPTIPEPGYEDYMIMHPILKQHFLHWNITEQLFSHHDILVSHSCEVLTVLRSLKKQWDASEHEKEGSDKRVHRNSRLVLYAPQFTPSHYRDLIDSSYDRHNSSKWEYYHREEACMDLLFAPEDERGKGKGEPEWLPPVTLLVANPWAKREAQSRLGSRNSELQVLAVPPGVDHTQYSSSHEVMWKKVFDLYPSSPPAVDFHHLAAAPASSHRTQPIVRIAVEMCLVSTRENVRVLLEVVNELLLVQKSRVHITLLGSQSIIFDEIKRIQIFQSKFLSGEGAYRVWYNDNVKFFFHGPEMRIHILKRSHYLIDFSLWQGSSRLALEAMSCGCVPILPPHGVGSEMCVPFPEVSSLTAEIGAEAYQTPIPLSAPCITIDTTNKNTFLKQFLQILQLPAHQHIRMMENAIEYANFHSQELTASAVGDSLASLID